MSEVYEGVKFSVIFSNNSAPQHPKIEQLMEYCRIFHEKNLAPPYPGGSAGNLSFRIDKQEVPFIITGTKIGLKDRLQNKHFVKVSSVDFEKKTVLAEGTREPSSEAMMHYAIYNARPDVNTIFHGHSPDILENADRLGITETKFAAQYGTIELVTSVLSLIENHNFLILKDHGFLAVGKDFDQAWANVQSVLTSALYYSNYNHFI